jgi:hypothetical protein
VREYPDRGGRLPYRLWYDEAEIEGICRRELELAGWPAVADGPATDVDTFIERRLGLAPDYVWLPRDVLGATEFTAKGAVRLQISAELCLQAEREPSAERLLRSTLAHEAAHVLLHRTLFLSESRSLFSGLSSRTELCRTVGVPAAGYTGEWWEWQANRGMAALLLPAGRLQAWLAEHGSPASVAPSQASSATAGEGTPRRPSPAAAQEVRVRVPPARSRVRVALREAAADAFGVSAEAVKRRLAQIDALALLGE